MNIQELLEQLPTPEPPGGHANYDSVIQNALNASPIKSSNYKKFKAWKLDTSSPVNFLPVRVDIENVSRCNFSCNMCQVSLWDNGKRADDMNLDSFQTILSQLPTLVEAKIQGFGEPLLNSEVFFDMVKAAKSDNLWVRTTTNASLLHVNSNIDKLLESGINEIQISLDAASEDVFKKIRKGSNPLRVFDNIKDLCSASKALPINPVKVNVTLQDCNYFERLSIIKHASRLGINSLNLTLALSGFGIQELELRNKRHEIPIETIIDDIEEMAQLQIRLVFLSFYSGVQKYDADNICPWPFSRTYIGSDMRISLLRDR